MRALEFTDNGTMRLLAVAALFLTGLGFSNWITMHSWGGAVYVYVGERRAPASVRTSSDYSAIDRQSLYRSVHAQLMASASSAPLMLSHAICHVRELRMTLINRAAAARMQSRRAAKLFFRP